jgi:hypothetical protein
MNEWEHDGGFSLHAKVRIDGWNREGLERLLRYCARPPFALERIEILDDERILYHLPKRTPDGRTMLQFTPLELIGRIAALIPELRSHRHRYYGVLAPNARLRPAVTGLDHAETEVDIGDTTEEGTPTIPTTTNPADTEAKPHSSSYYLWARLLARLFEVFPLKSVPKMNSVVAFSTLLS